MCEELSLVGMIPGMKVEESLLDSWKVSNSEILERMTKIVTTEKDSPVLLAGTQVS